MWATANRNIHAGLVLLLLLLDTASVKCLPALQAVTESAGPPHRQLHRRAPPDEKAHTHLTVPQRSVSLASSAGSSSFKSDASFSPRLKAGLLSPTTPLDSHAYKPKDSTYAFGAILGSSDADSKGKQALQDDRVVSSNPNKRKYLHDVTSHHEEEWIPHSMPKGYSLKEFKLAGSYYATTPDGAQRYIPSRDTAVDEEKKLPGEYLYGKLRGGLLMTKSQGKGYVRPPHHMHMFHDDMRGKELFPHDVWKTVKVLRPARK